jgi:hypothetical protein
MTGECRNAGRRAPRPAVPESEKPREVFPVPVEQFQPELRLFRQYFPLPSCQFPLL